MNLNDYMNLSNEKKFEYFMNTRTSTNRTAGYYVNWEKVNKMVKPFEVSLNTLNYLIGRENIWDEAKTLFLEQPNLLKAIPSLIASRDKKLDVLDVKNGALEFYEVDFVKINLEQIDKYMTFISGTGLLHFLQRTANRSLIDYVYGVEAGMDTNARKNRSGTQNEEILELSLLNMTRNTNWEYLVQATAQHIKSDWGVEVPEVVSAKKVGGRRYDGAVFNPEKNSVTLIETNFYGGGGSKLKAVSGEFTVLNAEVKTGQENVEFVWISDGPGWDTARNPMMEAFKHIPYIINLEMVKNGLLKEIIE